MNRVDVVLVGSLERAADGSVVQSGTFSTCTLVRAGDMRILVDTSQGYKRDDLLSGLASLGLGPEDVTDVVLTHSHADHVGNLALFPDAVLRMRAEGAFPGAVPVDRDMELAPGVRLVHTPGHTMDSMSVLVEGSSKTAIAGDACPLEANARLMVPPALNCDRPLAVDSLSRLTSWADVLVPGHGPMFSLRPTLKFLNRSDGYRMDMDQDAPETILYECPDCGDVTEHDMLKARFVKAGVSGTFRCRECGRVFSGTIRLPRNVPVKVLLSDGDTTSTTHTILKDDEIVEEGDEFDLEDGRHVKVTYIATKDGARRRSVQAPEIASLWVKAFGNLKVKVSVNDGRRTIPLYSEAEPDDEFAIGMILHLDDHDAVIHAIKTTNRLIRRGSAEARDITRIYAKMIHNGVVGDIDENEDVEAWDDMTDGGSMDLEDDRARRRRQHSSGRMYSRTSEMFLDFTTWVAASSV